MSAPPIRCVLSRYSCFHHHPPPPAPPTEQRAHCQYSKIKWLTVAAAISGALVAGRSAVRSAAEETRRSWLQCAVPASRDGGGSMAEGWGSSWEHEFYLCGVCLMFRSFPFAFFGGKPCPSFIFDKRVFFSVSAYGGERDWRVYSRREEDKIAVDNFCGRRQETINDVFASVHDFWLEPKLVFVRV